MTEEEAQSVVRELAGGDAYARLSALCDLVLAENQTQNLIARSTVDRIWSRHVLDSVQLVALAEGRPDPWLDIGTGGGFPGLAVAAVDPSRAMVLVEPRRLRASFLTTAANTLRLDRVTVRQSKIEAVRDVTAAVISARAVAATSKLLQAARHCATPATRWLLLRGSSGDEEAMFHVKQSLSDPAGRIVIVDGIPA